MQEKTCENMFWNVNTIRLNASISKTHLNVEKAASHIWEASELKGRKRESTMFDDEITTERSYEKEKKLRHTYTKSLESFFFESDGPQRNASVNCQVLSR